MWDFIDKVYVISLESETKRQEIVHENLKLIGLSDKTELFIVKRHPISGQHGCYESHVAVIDLAKKQKHSTILIFEDDFKFTPDWQTYLPFAKTFVQNTPRDKWDFLLLGVLPIRTHLTDINNNPLPQHITRVACGSLAHAYIVNQTIIKTGIHPQSFYSNNPIDIHLFCNPLKKNPPYRVFALDPMIVVQQYDGMSNATNAIKPMLQLISNYKLLRIVQKIANIINIATFICLIIILPIIIIIFVVTISVVLTKKHQHSKLQR